MELGLLHGYWAFRSTKAEVYDGNSSNNSCDALDNEDLVNRRIGNVSECSHTKVYLGKPVGTDGSIFIPVYISMDDKHYSRERGRPSSLITEDGD